jgi:hypothetical protein
VKPKREIKASQVVQDMRSGMSNQDLMEKYRLTSEGLIRVFRKLVHARAVKPDEVTIRQITIESAPLSVQIRQTPRCRPQETFPIHDMDDLDTDFLVKDLSEKGVQIMGMETSVGRHTTFLIEAWAFENSDPLIFDAQCRIDKTDGRKKVFVAGFEIVRIEPADLQQLRKIVQSIGANQ